MVILIDEIKGTANGSKQANLVMLPRLPNFFYDNENYKKLVFLVFFSNKRLSNLTLKGY